MQTYLTSGAHHGRTGRLYVWGPSRSKRKRRNRLDLCGSPPPVTPAQARLAVGRALRGHGAPLAASGQKHRWPPWFGLGYGVVCALGGVAAGEEPQLTRHGVVSGRACRGTGVHGAPGRSQAADSGPCQHCPGVCGPWQRRCGRDQCADPPCRQGLWLCRPQYPVVGYHRAGVAHWVSQRTRDLAGVGSALWPRPCQAQNAWGGGSRPRPRPGPDDPQVSQSTPPLCQGQTGKAAGVDALAHRGGPVGGAPPSPGDAAGAEPRPRHPTGHSNARGHARGGQAADPADRAVDHHRGGGSGQNHPCWFDPGACDCPQQGGEAGGVWPALSPESPRGWVCLWDVDPWGGGRVKNALAGAGGVPRDLWCAGHARVGGLRPGRLCYGNRQGARQRGGQADWHPAQSPRGVARCRGRPRDGPERARQDRRDHWHPEDRQIGVQQAQGTSVADAGDGRSPVSPLRQSAQTDAGPGTGRQVRRQGIGVGRTDNTATVERKEGGQEAPVTLKVVLRHALCNRVRWVVQAQWRTPRRLEIEKQFPQWYVSVSRLPPESINYNSAQEEPEKQEPYANQTNECSEPKEEFYDCKNLIEESQNQALCSFSNP